MRLVLRYSDEERCAEVCLCCREVARSPSVFASALMPLYYMANSPVFSEPGSVLDKAGWWLAPVSSLMP